MLWKMIIQYIYSAQERRLPEQPEKQHNDPECILIVLHICRGGVELEVALNDLVHSS